MLFNLIGNAVKFTERGRVSLSLTRVPAGAGDDRRWLRYTVRDTGVGIAPDALESLFKPFVQADSSTTRVFGGTGLGLAICRNLVELMGGTLKVTSELGHGSTFWFDLPVGEGSAAAILEREPVDVPDAIAARILVAEDNPVNQELICSLLARVGAEVTLATHGREAVDHARSGAFDLVSMDCQMPVLDGYQATAEIRAGEAAGERLPIIALTANAFADVRQRCFDAGMDDYLAKPVAAAALYQMLARWTGRARSTACPGTALPPHDDCAPTSRAPQAPPSAASPAVAALLVTIGPAAVRRVQQTFLSTVPDILARLAHAESARDLPVQAKRGGRNGGWRIVAGKPSG